jgi:hypothetical protein
VPPLDDDARQPELLRATPLNPKAVRWARAMATYRATLRRMSGGELAGQLAKWRRTAAKRGTARWLTERIQAVEEEIDRRDREPDAEEPETCVSGSAGPSDGNVPAGVATETPADAVVESRPPPLQPPGGGSHGTDPLDARRARRAAMRAQLGDTPDDDPWVRLQRDLLARTTREGDMRKGAFYEYALGLRPTLATEREKQRVEPCLMRQGHRRSAVVPTGRSSGDD